MPYHDFFYDPTRSDNEDRSAALAKSVIELTLRVPSETGAQVQNLILFSHYTRPPVTRDEMVLHDVDLAIFGESSDLFHKYEKDIRQEYAFVPEAEYRNGRTGILKHFLRDPFYFTPELCYSSYEDLARLNIRRSLDSLSVTQ